MTTITINKTNLEACDYDNGRFYTVVRENGSGLYTVINQDNEEEFLTRSELKEIADVNEIDETLEMMKNMDAGRVYTDDMMNFINENEYNELDDEDKEDYEMVEFIVK